jgi:hypothetical protein
MRQMPRGSEGFPMVPPFDDDALLSTQELAEAFAELLNLPLAAATLETKRVRGGGPPFEKYGKFIRYRWKAGRDWRLGQGRMLNSTSEARGAI